MTANKRKPPARLSLFRTEGRIRQDSYTQTAGQLGPNPCTCGHGWRLKDTQSTRKHWGMYSPRETQQQEQSTRISSTHRWLQLKTKENQDARELPGYSPKVAPKRPCNKKHALLGSIRWIGTRPDHHTPEASRWRGTKHRRSHIRPGIEGLD